MSYYTQNLPLDFPFIKNNPRAWPGSEIEAFTIIEVGYCYPSLKASFEGLEDKYLPKKLIDNTKSWTFYEVICSALSYRYVKTISKSLNPTLPLSAWYPISRLLMNSHISDDILSFLKVVDFFKNSKPYEGFILDGVKKRYNKVLTAIIFSLNNYKFPFADERCVRNVLNLTTVENLETVIFETVIKEYSVEKDLKKVSASISLFLNKINKIKVKIIYPSFQFDNDYDLLQYYKYSRRRSRQEGGESDPYNYEDNRIYNLEEKVENERLVNAKKRLRSLTGFLAFGGFILILRLWPRGKLSVSKNLYAPDSPPSVMVIERPTFGSGTNDDYKR